MTTFIEIILLIFIASFLVLQSKGGLGSMLGRRRRIVLDSCALIDGRIVEIVRNGFVADELVIPQFILSELQLLADGHDSHKRERARFGLDIANELQDASFGAKVTIDRTVFENTPATDDKLISLTKKLEAYLYTTDYNLAKIASIEGVGVLNVNELAQSLRPITLPGETLKLKIVQKGSGPNQGVGYLDDGTMIVVEGAAKFAGKAPVSVVVSRMHQTVAGKMVFGHIKEDYPSRPSVSRDPRESLNDGKSPSRHEVQKTQPKPKAKLHERLVSPMRSKSSGNHARRSRISPRIN